MGDDSSPTLSASALALDTYSQSQPTTLIINQSSLPCAQHTSDANDQHSSRDARDDCAVGQRPSVDASTDVSMDGQGDPQARHASSHVTCARMNEDLCCPHDHSMHAKRGVCSEGVGVAALSAPAPHLQGACLPLSFDHEHDQRENQMDLVRSTSVSNLSNSRAAILMLL